MGRLTLCKAQHAASEAQPDLRTGQKDQWPKEGPREKSGFRHVLHSFRAFLQYSVPNDSGRSRLQMYVLRHMCNLHILKPGQICLPEHVSHDLSFMPGKLEEHRVSIVSWTRSISK